MLHVHVCIILFIDLYHNIGVFSALNGVTICTLLASIRPAICVNTVRLAMCYTYRRLGLLCVIHG